MSMQIKKYVSYALLLALFLSIFFCWVTLTPLYKATVQTATSSNVAEELFDYLNISGDYSGVSSSELVSKISGAVRCLGNDGALSPAETVKVIGTVDYVLGIAKQAMVMNGESYDDYSDSSSLNFNSVASGVKAAHIIFLLVYILLIVSIIAVALLRVFKIKDLGFVQTIFTAIMFIFFIVFTIKLNGAFSQLADKSINVLAITAWPILALLFSIGTTVLWKLYEHDCVAAGTNPYGKSFRDVGTTFTSGEWKKGVAGSADSVKNVFASPWKCPVCGAMCAASTTFCSNCGAKKPGPRICSKCGSVIPEGAAFCSKCGTPYTAAPVSNPVPPAAPVSNPVPPAAPVSNPVSPAAPVSNPVPPAAPVSNPVPPAAPVSNPVPPAAPAENPIRPAPPVVKPGPRVCSKCGSVIPDGAAFCTNCGTPAPAENSASNDHNFINPTDL